MKLAYNSNGWRFGSLEETIQKLAQLGYSAIELSCQPHQLFPVHYSKKDANAIRQLASEVGIAISNLHAGDRNLLGPNAEPSLINPDANARKKRLEVNKAAIDLSVELGTDIMALTSGPLHREMTVSDSWRYLVDGLDQCIKYANEAGVRLILEPEPELFVHSITDFLNLVKDLEHPEGFGLNLDIGHSYCMYEDIPAIIRQTKHLLMHIHLEDISNRQHRHLIPGEGEIDFGPVQQALLEIGYSGYVSVELQEHTDNPYYAASLSRKNLLSWASSHNRQSKGIRRIWKSSNGA